MSWNLKQRSFVEVDYFILLVLTYITLKITLLCLTSCLKYNISLFNLLKWRNIKLSDWIVRFADHFDNFEGPLPAGLRPEVWCKVFVPCLYPCMSLSVSWLLTDCSELCWPTGGGGGGWWGSDHWLSVTWSGLVWLVSSHQPAVLHSPHMATRRHTDGSRTPTNQSETSRRPADQWEPGWQVEARPDCDGGWPQPWHQKTASWWLAGQREAPATLLSPLNTFISHRSPLTENWLTEDWKQ